MIFLFVEFLHNFVEVFSANWQISQNRSCSSKLAKNSLACAYVTSARRVSSLRVPVSLPWRVSSLRVPVSLPSRVSSPYVYIPRCSAELPVYLYFFTLWRGTEASHTFLFSSAQRQGLSFPGKRSMGDFFFKAGARTRYRLQAYANHKFISPKQKIKTASTRRINARFCRFWK